MDPWIVRFWRDAGFWDYLGGGFLLLAAFYVLFLIIKGCHGLIKGTPWWERNKESSLIELSGWIIAAILSICAMTWNEVLDANLYGIAAINTGVALILRFAAPIIWVSAIWLPWSRDGTEDPQEPMRLIQNHKIIVALNRGIISATVTSSTLASGKVEPDWLGSWWAIILLTSFACVTVTKIETIMQPVEIWHKLTRNQFRE